MRVLITGASGFTGRSMIRFLAGLKDVEIFGLARNDKPGMIHSSRVSWYFADLFDSEAIHSAISSADPDAVLHLAGLTRGTLPELRAVNVNGTRNLLDAVIHYNPSCPIVVVSSSAVYGYTGTAPIAETQPLKPVSDYGISKVEQETLCSYYRETTDCRICTARPFNLVGPGQPDSFVCGRVIRQIIERELKTRTAIELMETVSFRDFIDVRDVVQGYWSLLSHRDFSTVCAGKHFNLGSGTPHSIAEVIRTLETITGRKYPVRLPRDPVFVPIPYQQSNNSRIRTTTGWKPILTLSESLRDMLNAARKQAGSNG
jgi:nucleoside-diphosphate-sugar epimerase